MKILSGGTMKYFFSVLLLLISMNSAHTQENPRFYIIGSGGIMYSKFEEDVNPPALNPHEKSEETEWRASSGLGYLVQKSLRLQLSFGISKSHKETSYVSISTDNRVSTLWISPGIQYTHSLTEYLGFLGNLSYTYAKGDQKIKLNSSSSKTDFHSHIYGIDAGIYVPVNSRMELQLTTLLFEREYKTTDIEGFDLEETKTRAALSAFNAKITLNYFFR